MHLRGVQQMNQTRITFYMALTAVILAVGLTIFQVTERWSLWGDPAESAMTGSQGQQILNELRQIRRVLESGALPPSIAARDSGSCAGELASPGGKSTTTAKELVTVKIDGRPALGNKDAPVVIAEFVDFECPFCNKFYRNVFPALKKKYINTGQVQFVVLDLPLSFHKNARPAAQAAWCAQEQARFWAMKDILIKNYKNLSPSRLPGFAKRAGLHVGNFEACMDSQRNIQRINESIGMAKRLGITGTPTFVIGKRGDGVNLTGLKIVGAQPLGVFEEAIQQELGRKP